MKNVFTCIAVLFTVIFSFAADPVDNVTRVELGQIEETSQGPRSAVQKPQVFIDGQNHQLLVGFTSSDNYTLFVYDTSGSVRCQFALLSDGVTHLYQLSDLESGQYTVVLESEKRTFEGVFDI